MIRRAITRISMVARTVVFTVWTNLSQTQTIAAETWRFKVWKMCMSKRARLSHTSETAKTKMSKLYFMAQGRTIYGTASSYTGFKQRILSEIPGVNLWWTRVVSFILRQGHFVLHFCVFVVATIIRLCFSCGTWSESLVNADSVSASSRDIPVFLFYAIIAGAVV